MVGLFAAGISTFVDLYAPQGTLPELSRDFHIGPAEASLTLSMATAGLAVGVLIWAWLADRIGRLLCMRIAVCTAVVIGTLGVMMPSYEGFLSFRALSGFILGAVPVLAVSYIHELLGGARAAAAASIYIAGTTIGGATGRLVSGPLAAVIGWRLAVLVACGISLLAAVLFVALSPSSGVRPSAPEPQGARLGKALKDMRLVRLYIQSFLLTGAFVAVYNFLGFRLELPPFSLPAALASLIFVSYFAGTVSSRLGGAFMARIGSARTITSGLVIMALGLGLMLTSVLALIIAGLVLFTAGFFMSHATAIATTGQLAEADFRSQASALYNIGFYLGSGVLAWVIGLVYEAWGWAGMSAVIGALLIVVILMKLPATVRGPVPVRSTAPVRA